MPAILLQTLLSVLTKIVMAACGEKIIAWFIFTVCEYAVKSTKTPCDDEFYRLVREAYAGSVDRQKEADANASSN